MSKLDHWIDNKIVQNAFVWFLLFLILLTTIQAESRIATSCFIILLLAPAVYINNLLILPFLRKKLLVFLSLFLLNLLVFTTISVSIIRTVLDQEFEVMMFVNFFGILVLALVFASAIKIARDSFTRRQHEQEAELKLLKEQLNPHFLFNTLNNLYGLSVVKSDKLPDLMLKLSDLLRYSLYETKETYVPLEKEITYLENYISLEKIRLEDSTNIRFEKSGNLSSKKIAPMLFIVFVENAFKYLGVIETKKSKVTVSIKEENNTLTFTCDNTVDAHDINDENLEKDKSGIGLQNAKKRLALMYPEKHTLTIKENKGTFSVVLKLDL
ncbi:sensor histidine kinase [Dokdonia sp.]|uniref:sensor histidine kinase n=1 Tax=Dokdonia sp. TaxID=2024995 RepID=UPI003265F1B5